MVNIVQRTFGLELVLRIDPQAEQYINLGYDGGTPGLEST
jgi:hypothetical protein